MPGQHTEYAFETAIEHHLTTVGGYPTGDREGFDPHRAIFPADVLAFIKETQPDEWAYLEGIQKAKAEETLLDDLYRALDSEHEGCLSVLRHGSKCFGKLFHVAYFAPASGMNLETKKRYETNVLTIPRQPPSSQGRVRPHSERRIGRSDRREHLHMSVKEAAIQVLRDADGALSVQEISDRILAEGLWQTSGKTACATSRRSSMPAIKKHGDASAAGARGDRQPPSVASRRHANQRRPNRRHAASITKGGSPWRQRSERLTSQAFCYERAAGRRWVSELRPRPGESPM